MFGFSNQFGVSKSDLEGVKHYAIPSADVPCSCDKLLTAFLETPFFKEDTFKPRI